MKKTFALQDPKHKPDRVVEAVKAEINKYLARERRKELPSGVDYWDFDCAVGVDADSAKAAHVKELSKAIDAVAVQKVPSVYVEILAKPGVRAKKASRGNEEIDEEN